MRGKHRRRRGPSLFARVVGTFPGPAGQGSHDPNSLRRFLGLTLVATLLAVSGTAGAANESTTSTSEQTTTTVAESSTTTVESSTTTTIPSSTTVTSEPSSTTTTLFSGSSTTTPTSDLSPADGAEHDPEPERAEFRVGSMRPPAIVFPIAGPHSFIDTFGADRDGGRRRHAGIDIFARKGVPVVAVADGVVEEVSEEYLAGQYVIVRHDDGWRSKYLHLDDDNPGTDDGLATGYASSIEVGVRVSAGTLLGFVGDSGNAESTVPHLHFGLFQPNGLPVNPYPALARAPDAQMTTVGGGMRTLNTELVGHLDPDLRGFNAGVAVNEDQVYMGTWGNDEVCPGTGVRVIDVSNPEQPIELASFAGSSEFPGTSADSVWVGPVHTREYSGDIAIVGLRVCDQERRGTTYRFVGFAAYDIDDPEDPTLISAVHSGWGTLGASDVDVVSDHGRALVLVTVPGSHLDHPDGLGDVRLYDLTDPSEITELSEWHLRDDGPPLLVGLLASGAGDLSLSAVGASWVAPDRAVVAHAEAGLVSLDLSDPENPRHIALASPHNAALAETTGVPSPAADGGWVFEETVIIQDDERLEPHFDELGMALGWGQQVFYDISDQANPRPIATFGTERSKPGVDGEVGLDGYYSVRGSVPFGDWYQLAPWSSDGVRVVDIRDPSGPLEVAYFVPPPRPDPQGWWVAPDGSREMPLTWAAASGNGFVYLVDANSGLWIVRVTIPTDEGALPLPE